MLDRIIAPSQGRPQITQIDTDTIATSVGSPQITQMDADGHRNIANQRRDAEPSHHRMRNRG